MVKKGEQTRLKILEEAAQVFSVKGYFGTSLEDLMTATSLTKGGIYNHFGSKEALALEAFTYATGQVSERFRQFWPPEQTTQGRLMAIVHTFRSLIEDPVLMGGCPLLNAAVEADDTNLPLLEKTQQFAEEWHSYITRTLNKGKQLGNVRQEVDPEVVASVLISTLEGGIMLSKLHHTPVHIQRIADYLTTYIDSLLVPET